MNTLISIHILLKHFTKINILFFFQMQIIFPELYIYWGFKNCNLLVLLVVMDIWLLCTDLLCIHSEGFFDNMHIKLGIYNILAQQELLGFTELIDPLLYTSAV